MSRLNLIRDQQGMTLIELLIATAAGVVVFMGLTMVVIASVHQSTRLSKRVHATQEARTALQRIVTGLHSSCVAAEVAPIQENSSDTSLKFIYQIGSAAALTPVVREIKLTGTTLSESIYPSVSGSTPSWKFATSPTSTKTLMTNVSAVSASVPLFSYYAFNSGVISSTPLGVPLTGTNAALAVQVNIALKVSAGGSVSGAKGPAIVQDSALLRFSPPAYRATTANLPCE
jgi:prepilin-type N-terminal cleavage/methylation domain-containing protein